MARHLAFELVHLVSYRMDLCIVQPANGFPLRDCGHSWPARLEMVMTGECSTCQFFADDSYEYVQRFVDAETAVRSLRHYATSVGAKIGTTKRVIVTDGGDSIVLEWEFGKGITFPPALTGQPV